jgi:hypothetical protein
MREQRMTAALAALLALAVIGFAQPQRRQTNADKQAGKNAANKERPRRTEEGGSVTPKTVERAVITGGEVRRTVKGDESIVLHMGMSPSGATVAGVRLRPARTTGGRRRASLFAIRSNDDDRTPD